MTAHDLAIRYIDLWNETDQDRRRSLLDRTFTPTATYVDPLMSGDGVGAIDGLIAAVHGRFPGARFALRGEPEAHHDRLRFSWRLTASDGTAIADGTDFGIVAEDGRLSGVTGFLDRAAA